MMTFIFNTRINHTPVALIWENMEDVGTGKPYTGPKYTREFLDDNAIERMRTVGYNSRYARLSRIEWEDGSTSFAFVRFGQDRVYINSASGSPMVTACLDPNRERNPEKFYGDHISRFCMVG